MLYRIALFYMLFIQVLWAHTLPLTVPKTLKEAYTASLVIHSNHPYTFFCQTPFSTTGSVIIQDCPNCAQFEAKIKWFYIVPPEWFAAELPCFKEKLCINRNNKWYKGRSCCEKNSPLYAMMSRDLYNFAPETPQLAKLRRHYDFLPLSEATIECAFKLDKKAKTIYVDPSQLGLIARTFLYMADTYSLRLPADLHTQFLMWHKHYPPSEWERSRNQQIKAIQGNENIWVSLSDLDTATHHNRYPQHL